MSDENLSSFWTEGPERLRESLTERRSLLDSLAAKLRSLLPGKERAAVEKKIRDVLDDYEPTEEEIDQCIFLLADDRVS